MHIKQDLIYFSANSTRSEQGGFSMKIVVLDGYPGNPGDLSWSGIEALGDLTVYDRTTPDETVKRLKGAQMVLLNKAPLTREMIEQLPDLQYVGVLGTGYNMVDCQAASEHGITVTNVPGYSSGHVAQLVFSLLLELCDRAALHDAAVKNGEWENCPDFTFRKSHLVELADLTLGIVGYGSIGHAVAQIARAFGMKVIAATRTPREAEGVEFVSLDELLRRSDVVTLHCPLTAESKNLINAERLALMKPTAYLINTARGPLIDEKALEDALKNHTIAGAGLDVICHEPALPGSDFLRLPNLVVTPHIAWASDAARRRLMDISTRNAAQWAHGQPVNVVASPAPRSA